LSRSSQKRVKHLWNLSGNSETNHSTEEIAITRITSKIIASLEQGVRPWIQPWNAEHAAGKITRPLRHGVNVLLFIFRHCLSPSVLSFFSRCSATDLRLSAARSGQGRPEVGRSQKCLDSEHSRNKSREMGQARTREKNSEGEMPGSRTLSRATDQQPGQASGSDEGERGTS
jgi:hypothetical protein